MSTADSPLGSPELLRGVIDAAPEGNVICACSGADHPVVYVNAAFERMSGYPAVELGADAAGNALVGLRNNDASGMIYRRYTAGSGWDGASSNVAGFNFYYSFDWTMAMGANGPAVAVTDDETRILGVHF